MSIKPKMKTFQIVAKTYDFGAENRSMFKRINRRLKRMQFNSKTELNQWLDRRYDLKPNQFTLPF